MWTRADPAAGDPGRIRMDATSRRFLVERIRTAVRELADAEAEAADWRGRVADAFRESIPKVAADADRIATRIEDDAAALDRYAGELDALRDELGSIRVRQALLDARRTAIERRLDELEAYGEWVPDSGILTDRQRGILLGELRAITAEAARLEADLDDLVDRRREADRELGRAFERSSGWAPGAPAPLDLDGLADRELLLVLAGLTPEQLRLLVERQPELAERVSGIDDPALVAEWWARLGADATSGLSEAQLVLLTMLPGVVGTLDGVPFGVRDVANRTVLAAELFAVRSQLALETSGDVPLEMAESIRLAGYLEHLEAIAASLAQRRDVPLQLVVFRPPHPSEANRWDEDPLAAISVGDLDAATEITVAVPGMGSTVASTMESWTAAAWNLQQQQRVLAADYALGEHTAVVAWVDYDAPDMVWQPSLEVIASANARVGGERLAGFLEGITAARGWPPGENLNVVGHSYGSTTAAFAVAATPVDSFVLLGSAGLDPETGHVSELQVDPGRVWASEADGDWIADLGRTWEHPVDPTGAAFGGNGFSSEGGTVDGVVLRETTSHPATPATEEQLAGRAPGDDRGYLDSGTTAIYNTAVVTLGLDEQGVTVIR